MNLSFYTIDDLRLGSNLWTETRFDAVQEALAHYRSLPGDTVKELGLVNGTRKLPLIRRTGLSSGGQDLEDVLVTTCLTQTPWRGPRRCWRRRGNASPP